MSTPDFEASIARLTHRVDKALAQSRRFDQLAEQVRDWAEHWSVDAIARWLEPGHRPSPQADNALVALALKGTFEAGRRLREYDATAMGDDHDLLRQVALIEWERRYDRDYYAAA